jgi:hypothetical protein
MSWYSSRVADTTTTTTATPRTFVVPYAVLLVVLILLHQARPILATTTAAAVLRDSTCYSTLLVGSSGPAPTPPRYPKDATAYQNAANVWANLDAFDALYISYHSCAYVYRYRPPLAEKL